MKLWPMLTHVDLVFQVLIARLLIVPPIMTDVLFVLRELQILMVVVHLVQCVRMVIIPH